MFSRQDINKELGKGISFYPFNPDNIKENSINFSVGEFAWSLKSGYVIKCGNDKYRKTGKNDDKSINIKKGSSAIIKNGDKETLILLPHSTTIVETKEVIGLSNYIGGTIHSKVGIVAHGVGHISTMMGPCFCGHLMIAVHNVTDEVISINVGETFISLVFHYLDTPSRIVKNSNISGHVDKLAELGININARKREMLTEDWKQDFEQISANMKKSLQYKEYKSLLTKNRFKEIKKYINLHNIIVSVFIIFGVIGFAYFAAYLDTKYNTTVWTDRYWNVLVAAILVPFIGLIYKLFKRE